MENIEEMEPGSQEKKNEAETYKIMATAQAETVKAQQNWLSVAIAGLGALGSLALSYFMFQKPYKEMDKNNFVTSQTDKETQKDAKNSVKDILRKSTRL